jgi:peptidoglycan-N-acetylglucosamine deacetylase
MQIKTRLWIISIGGLSILSCVSGSTESIGTSSGVPLVSQYGSQAFFGEPFSSQASFGEQFGSQAILEGCWTQNQLNGSRRDKKVRRPISNPYRSPPKITDPYHSNPPVESRLQNSIRHVIPRGNQKIVALTFDLCERMKERTGYDAKLVNYLRAHRIKATFYAGGKWMHSHPEKAMQLMADPLFEIGNHAWTHGNMRVLRGREMENQILWTQGQYEVLRNQLETRLELGQCRAHVTEINKIPLVPRTFRFPYGTCSRASLNALAKYGLPAVQWDVVTADPSRKQSAKAIARAVLRNVKPGSIIIAHANGRGYNTAKALPKFIPKLQRRGYRFVTVTELLNSAEEVITTRTCYELRPGDNKRYDRLFGKGTE